MGSPRATVLIVHDVLAMRNAIATIVARAGCSTIQAAGFEAALKVASKVAPDIVITDELIITVSTAAYAEMRLRFSRAAVIALVAPFRLRRGCAEHIDCGIEKPLDEARVLRALEWSIELTASGATEQSAS